MDRTSEIRRVLLITLFLNLIVSVAKVFYGYSVYSVAIISDGFHSLFDGISNIIGLVGIYLASHPPDEKHPYGHRKYETVFTIFVGVLMFITCIEIFKRVYQSITGKQEAIVTTEAFVIMVITMLINIFVAAYERKMGKKLDSEYLIADSRHTKSDIYASIGVIAGLALTKLGYPLADPVIGAVVGILVAKAGIDIIKESTEVLADRTRIDLSLIGETARKVEGVLECHDIRARGTTNNMFVDLHILVNPGLSVEDAHRIAHLVEDSIKKTHPEIIDVVVHIEPSKTV